MLGRQAIEMGADQARAVGVSRAQGEFHPGFDVFCVPAGNAVGLYGFERADEVACRVRLAVPDMALVEMVCMSTKVGQTMPLRRSVEGSPMAPRRVSGLPRLAVGDHDVGADQALAGGCLDTIDTDLGQRRIGENEALGSGRWLSAFDISFLVSGCSRASDAAPARR